MDEALVKMAQLNKRREKLDGMRKRLPKTRKADGFMQSHFIEYIYVNYNLKKVQEDYQAVCDEIARIQLELLWAAIYKWQRGESLPSVDHLFALSRLLQVSMQEILVESGQVFLFSINSLRAPHFSLVFSH